MSVIQKIVRFFVRERSCRLSRLEEMCLAAWERVLPQGDRERFVTQRSQWILISRELNGKSVNFHYVDKPDRCPGALFEIGGGSRCLAMFSVRADADWLQIELWAYEGRISEICYDRIPSKRYTDVSVESVRLSGLSDRDRQEPIRPLPPDYESVYAKSDEFAEKGITVFKKDELERLPLPAFNTWHIPLCQINDRYYVTLFWERPDTRPVLYDFINDEEIESADTMQRLIETALAFEQEES